MATIELKASKRLIEGKKARQLRSKGVTPVHLFGPGIASLTIQCETPVLKRTLAEAGHTRLVTLYLEGEDSPRTVMVREVQFGALRGDLLHVDFYQVRLAENIKVDVPIVLVGEAPAIKEKGNSLVQELNELTVECLPASIPNTVEIDVSGLMTADDMVRVRDIVLGEGIAILNDEDVVVARIAEEQVEEIPPKPVAEEAVAEAEEEAGEEAPGEAKAEAPARAEKKAEKE